MSSPGRFAVGALAFLPISAVVAFAVFLAIQSGSTTVDDGFGFLLLIAIYWKMFAAIVVFRLFVGAALALHAWRHLADQRSSRTLWAIRLFFFTEMRAPQYWFEHVR